MHTALRIQYQSRQPTFVRTPTGAHWKRPAPIITTALARPSSADSRLSPDAPDPADVPTAVATLLGLTTQLRALLRLWARRAATEAQVSDAFVLVGMQFNATVAAFDRWGVDMRDLASFPAALRAVLERLLGEQPAEPVLDRYLPCIRRVLYALLAGLRARQAPYWAAVARARADADLDAAYPREKDAYACPRSAYAYRGDRAFRT